MHEFLNNIAPYQMLGMLFVIALIAHGILHVVLQKITTHASNTKNQWDDYLINAISMPLKVLIWFAWIYFSIGTFKGEIAVLSKIIDYLDIVPIFIITWGIIRLISRFEAYILQRATKVDYDSIKLIARLSKILIIMIIALGVAQYWGFSISSLLTFGGVGGIVIGFAAKDMLSNIFGGLMIQMDKPFSTGDWIRSSEFEGVVEKIGWRMTRIRTFNKNPVYIPNSIFSTLPIETPSRMTNRRLKEVIGIRYDDLKKLPDILQAVEAMLKNCQDIDHTQALRVYFNYFNASSLDFNIYAFTKTIGKDEYQQVKQRVLLEIATIIEQNGAEIAYPTQTLHLLSQEARPSLLAKD